MPVSQQIEQMELFPGVEQIQYQHVNTKGYVAILRQFKDGNKHQVTIPAQALPDRIYDLCRPLADCWISQNGFYKQGTRKVTDIGQLVSLFVDLDCHKLGIAPDVANQRLYKDYIETKLLPRPSMIIHSGQGLQVIWRIKPESAYSLPTWQGVEDWLINQLKPLGSDPQARDAARVLRIAGTFNLKNNTLVEIQYDSDKIYSLTDICKRYIVPLIPVKPSKEGLRKPAKIKKIFTEHSLFYARMHDIKQLITMRRHIDPNHGSRTWGREMLLFLFRYYNCMFSSDPEKSLEETLELNSQFSRPLSEAEVIRATRSAEITFFERNTITADKKSPYKRTGYNYRTAKLVELLQVTSEEQKHMKNLIGPKEKAHRQTVKRYQEGRKDRRSGQAPSVDRQTYLFECQQANKDKVTIAHDLRDKGLSQRAIAKELQISVSTVNTYLKRGVFGGGLL